MRTSIGAALTIAALALSPGSPFAEESADSLERLAVDMAHTPEHHAALAEHYRAKAVEARAEMRRHERVGKSYDRGLSVLRESMQRHCQDIARQYAGIAEDYEALARLQDEEAKQAK